MQTFQYIPPREVSVDPVIGGINSLLKSYNTIREARKADQEKRMDNIMGLANQVDFASTISTANKAEQINIKESLMRELTGIVKEGVSRNGGLKAEDNFKAMMIIKEAGLKIGEISAGETKYHEITQTYAKEPARYDPKRFAEFQKAYMEKGHEAAFKINALVEKPIFFEQWAPDYNSANDKLYKTAANEIKGNELIQTKRAATPEQRTQRYVGELMNEPRRLKGTKERFKEWANNNKEESVKMLDSNNESLEGDNFNKSAVMYGIKYEAPRLLEDKEVRVYQEPKTTGSNKKIEDVKGIETEDGGTVYDFSSTPVTLEDEVNVYNKSGKLEKMTLSGAKAFEGGYGKLPDGTMGKYFKVNARKTIPATRYSSATTVTGTFIVPYEDVASSVKRKVNLIGIDKFEQEKQNLKKIEW